MFKKQGTSKRSASTSSCDIKPGFGEATPTDMGSQASACDMAWASEELELSEEELATVVGGKIVLAHEKWAAFEAGKGILFLDRMEKEWESWVSMGSMWD